VIGKQEFTHCPLRFFDLFALGGDLHAIRADDRARRLQLWHFFDPHKAHTTGRLDLEVLVIAERWNAETLFSAHIDQPGALVDVKFLLVYRYLYLFS
jgi:hypothetical protein